MPSIKVAAAQHANRHAYNGGDPLTPASIHAADLKHEHALGDINELPETLERLSNVSDTGWRDVTALVAPDVLGNGIVRLRRVEDRVTLRLMTLTPAVNNSTYVHLFTTSNPLPIGFRPEVYNFGEVTRQNSTVTGFGVTVWQMRATVVGQTYPTPVSRWNTTEPLTGDVTYLTGEAWPTTLPGTPAGGGNSGDGPALSVAWSNVIGKPTTFPPSEHIHEVGDITGAVKTVNDLQPDASGNVTIDIPEITWSAVTGKPTTFTPTPHDHSMANVTGLSTALNGKAAKTHTHTKAQVSGLPTIYTTIVDVSVSNSVNGNVILDWPSGMFSSAPVVTTSAIGQFYAATTGTPNTNSVNIAVRHVNDSVATATVPVNVIAVLM